MSRDINALHPLTKMLAEQFVINAKAIGYNVKITDCVRDKNEQNNLSASVTNAKFPYSYHNWGLAFDICQDSSEPYPSYNTKEGKKFWDDMTLIGERLGLVSGARWTNPVDRPHFQLELFGTVNSLIVLYKTPEKFFKSSLFTITTPTTEINVNSSTKKVGWLQTRLNVLGFPVKIDGFLGESTLRAFNSWKQSKDGQFHLDNVVSGSECKLLGR